MVGTVSQAQSCGDYIPTGSSSIICANTLNCNAFKDQGQGLHESLGTFPKFIPYRHANIIPHSWDVVIYISFDN